MDSDRFDALVRAFSEGTTRRRLTRLLGGLALGALLRPLASAAEKGGTGKGKGKGNDGTVPEDPTDDEVEDDTAATVTPAASGDKAEPVKPDTAEHETGKDEKKGNKDTPGNEARATDNGKPGTHDTAGNEKGKDGGNEKATDGTKGGHGKDQGTGTQGNDGQEKRKQGKQDNDRTEARATRDRKQDTDGTKATAGKKPRTTHNDGTHDTDETVTPRASRDGTQGKPDSAGKDTDATVTMTASATAGTCRQPGESCSGNAPCCYGTCFKRICPPCTG